MNIGLVHAVALLDPRNHAIKIISADLAAEGIDE